MVHCRIAALPHCHIRKVVPSGIEPESRASETLILSIVLRDRIFAEGK